jgi:hypothetical protein
MLVKFLDALELILRPRFVKRNKSLPRKPQIVV